MELGTLLTPTTKAIRFPVPGKAVAFIELDMVEEPHYVFNYSLFVDRIFIGVVASSLSFTVTNIPLKPF
ncbi:hypothetical protein KSF_066890 [Reticulibacter mediterranei]|uniref:Uncharacterized protein n=1 Tax=Reticulibacter mediterranei TaxID=2778369 RepID=A0A8J3ILC8_9CHLR|nr:hypothetical protein KSF_066890 [Reticulibacter mediterranei]